MLAVRACYGPRVVQEHPTDRLLREAAQQSFLAALPGAVLEQLTADAIRLDVPAGSTIYREGEAPRVALVARGLLRVYLTSTEGLKATRPARCPCWSAARRARPCSWWVI